MEASREPDYALVTLICSDAKCVVGSVRRRHLAAVVVGTSISTRASSTKVAIH